MPKKKNLGRPFSITTQEISTITFVIGFVFFAVPILNDPYFPQFYLILYVISVFVMAAGLTIPNYMITKYNLNMEIDRMTNPNYENWIRVTKNHKIFRRIVETGPLGQSKGLVAGYNADIINRGNYTVTLQNGNHAIICPDVMSTNADLEEEMGWKLIKRKFMVFGYDAYRRAIQEEKIDNLQPIVVKEKKKHFIDYMSRGR